MLRRSIRALALVSLSSVIRRRWRAVALVLRGLATVATLLIVLLLAVLWLLVLLALVVIVTLVVALLLAVAALVVGIGHDGCSVR